MKFPTPLDFLRASTHLHQAHDNALLEYGTASMVGQISDAYSKSCIRHLSQAAQALGYNLVPAIPKPVPAMDTPTQEATYERVGIFTKPKLELVAAASPSDVGQPT